MLKTGVRHAGMLSQALCPYVKSIVGVDISPASVEQYNIQAANQGLTPEEMKAVCIELKGEPGELGDARFDLVIVSARTPYDSIRLTPPPSSQCCASYHHFPSIEETTRVLAHFLKPGGSLLVTDIKAAPDGRVLFRDTHHHIVAHTRGLTEEAMRAAFEGTCLVGFAMKDVFTARMKATGEDTLWFVARGVKPA